jgi:hypothetical protein
MHRQNQTGRLPTGRGFTISWPRKILGPCPGLKELNLLCWSLFVILLILPLSVFLYLNLRTASGSLRSLHSDFVYFYGIGQIANAHPAIRIYDPALQLQTFSRIYALTNGTYGPSPYPPFVALFLSLFARLPFDAAYILWAALSLTMYIVGISATVKAVLPPQRFLTSLTLCLALAFGPFLFGTLLNGQLAAVAVFSIGIALSNEARSKPFASGVALSLLAYKPTLLLLLLPMLLLTRRYKTLFGFLTGASALLLLTTAFAGIKIWPAYVHFLDYFSRTVGVGGHSALHSGRQIEDRAAHPHRRHHRDRGISGNPVAEVVEGRRSGSTYGLGGNVDMHSAPECLCPHLRLRAHRHCPCLDPRIAGRSKVDCHSRLDYFSLGFDPRRLMDNRGIRQAAWHSTAQHLPRRSRSGSVVPPAATAPERNLTAHSSVEPAYAP